MNRIVLTVAVFLALSARAFALKPLPLPAIELGAAELQSALLPDAVIHFELREFTPHKLERLRGQLSDGVVLTAAAERTAIPIQATIGPEGGSDRPAELVVRPVSALAPGWYELRLLADELRAADPSPRLTRFEDGSVGTRIRVGSGPVIARVEVCPGTWRGTDRARLVFSEPVGTGRARVPERAVQVLGSDGEPIACRDAARAYPELVTARLDAGDFAAVWELDCGPIGERAHFIVSPEVVSASGVPVGAYGERDARGAEVAFERRRASSSEGCAVAPLN